VSFVSRWCIIRSITEKDVGMKNSFYVMVVLLFSLILQSQAGETKDRIYIKNIARQAAKEHKLLVIEFWSPSCNPCMALKRDIFENKMQSEFVHQLFSLFPISPTDSLYKSLWDHFHLEYQSSVIYVDKNGNEINRSVGYNGDRDAYVNMMREIAVGKNLYKDVVRKYRRDTLNVLNCCLMARALAYRYEFNEATRFYRKILISDPVNKYGFRDECLFKIAEMDYTLSGNIKKLREFADMRLNSLYGPKAYQYIINDFISKKDRTECIVICETGLHKYPESWEILNKYAWAICTFNLQDEYSKALSMVQKSISLNPSRPGTYSTNAWIYFEMGDKEKAIQLQKKAIEIFPDRGFIQDLEKFRK
jgi:thioredoxin-related protein